VKHVTPPALAFLDEALAQARRDSLLRERGPAAPPAASSFCSNDYLGLARLAAPSAASGAGASRLVGGDRPVHERLEATAAALVHQESALVFTSGYAANLGTLSALAGPGDLVVSDALNHASIIDGARLSRARVEVVPHLDVDAVARALAEQREGRAFVVTESYFSMDADSPDLPALRTLCDRFGAALVVDEAHALGVFGPEGRGLCAETGTRVDVLVGTFGKAFGAGGAFVAGCDALTGWLWNRARSFVFSTGLSPAVAAAAQAGLERAANEPQRREQVHAAAAHLRRGMAALGLAVAGSGHIIPWLVGEPARAMSVAAALRARGLDVRAIRPPSVPAGTARLRLTVTADHRSADVEHALGLIEAAVRETCSGKALGR
jgi:8-amino-7-oxononanoate synthase